MSRVPTLKSRESLTRASRVQIQGNGIMIRKSVERRLSGLILLLASTSYAKPPGTIRGTVTDTSAPSDLVTSYPRRRNGVGRPS